jgi:hypothetical protein
LRDDGIAPEMPTATYSCGETVLPVWPTWPTWNERLLREAGRDMPAIRPALRSVFVGSTMEQARALGGDKLADSYEMMKNWGLFRDVLAQNLASVDYQHVTERAFIGDPRPSRNRSCASRERRVPISSWLARNGLACR